MEDRSSDGPATPGRRGNQSRAAWLRLVRLEPRKALHPHEYLGLVGDALENQVQQVGRELAASMPSMARHPLKALDERAMQAAAGDMQLRAALFRFIDVAPACRSLDDLANHLTSYLDRVDERPAPLDAALKIGHTRAGRTALGAAAAAGVKHIAHRFIVGETPRAVGGQLSALWKGGVSTSVDLLGEATVTAAEADRYATRCQEALREIASVYRRLPERPLLERDRAGRIPRPNLSVKVSALTPLLRPDAPERGKRDAAVRLHRLLEIACEHDAHLHVDMESLDSREVVLDLVLELLERPRFADEPSVGVVLQAYLRDSPQQLERLLDWAAAHPRPVPLVIRLVKGAYWDHEVIEARQHGWPAPVFEAKEECDRNFEALTQRLVDSRFQVRVAIASHNLRSVSHAIAYNRLTGGDDSDIELQVLRGLGDELQDALASSGFRVRTYCPVGDLVAGIAYLVRRLLENTSNESFLHERARGADLDALLAAP
jgi:RHH-type proline utilization regulon transcriptional repressor/proline dehydrogenase/delta 1-pyrroline-5-carboxylate dehydrogenase